MFSHNICISFSVNLNIYVANAHGYVWCIETELSFSNRYSKDDHLQL